MDRNLFWLTDGQFAKIESHLPKDTRGKPRVDDHRVINGIVHVLRSGCRWVDAPAAYGPRKTLYNRYVRWADKGVWTGLFEALASAGGPPTQVLIDSSAGASPPDMTAAQQTSSSPSASPPSSATGYES